MCLPIGVKYSYLRLFSRLLIRKRFAARAQKNYRKFGSNKWKVPWRRRILSIYLVTFASSQILRQYTATNVTNQGICRSRVCTSLRTLYDTYKDCVVVLGNLQVTIMERTRSKDFVNVSFPNLREVTGFLVVYRVNGLDSLGQLFPNLARIRGEQLLNNYGLIIHDMSTLREIGLYGLLKIDRGGVIVWGVPQACFVDTVDWKTIAPRSRHVINPQSLLSHCNFRCTCSRNATVNHCWNNMKCQIYLDGPEADKCHEQCFGCRKTRSNECSLCRHYTYNRKCVRDCPHNTIILPDSKYCITNSECKSLTGWVWNNTCVFECPVDYVKQNTSNGVTCRLCTDCDKTCGDLVLQSISSIQAAEHCVYINGSLTIHVRAVTEAMDELRTYLSRIQEVYDYIHIHGSLTISSLDFLPSLQRIRGRKLKKDTYSLVVSDMSNLQALFTKNVTENLVVDRGTLRMLDNPMLCVSQIEKLLPRFPDTPSVDIDLPEGRNGYSAGCKEVSVGVQIRTVNETSALIMFSPKNLNAHYSVLYVRLPPGVHQIIVPETCSESEWNAVDAQSSYGHTFAMAELTSLRPASIYAVCIESFDPFHNKLARSIIYNFTTPVGVPEPPFIRELVASNSGTVVIRWVDHKDYRPHLTHYELDVSLIEIYEKDVAVKDQCKHSEAFEIDLTQHAVVMRPPEEYARGCESMCGILSSVTAGAMVEEFFDICSSLDCNAPEEIIKQNTSFGNYVKTMVLNLKSPRNDFQIGKLAPFRDYRFRLRACTSFHCSRSARGVVRTLPMERADIPSIKDVKATNFGQVTVKWDAPKYTNGPVLSYSIEVLPKSKTESLSYLLPQSWCVVANQTHNIVRSVKADKYLVRVCTRSMAFDKACSEWETVVPHTEFSPTWWWTGIIFGVLIYAISILIGRSLKRRRDSIDLVPIVDYTSTLRSESEPPGKMFSDFAQVYTIPLRESKLE